MRKSIDHRYNNPLNIDTKIHWTLIKAGRGPNTLLIYLHNRPICLIHRIKSRTPYPVSRIPYPVPRVPYPVSRIPYPVSRTPYPVPRIPYPVPRIPYPVSRIL